MAGGGKRCPSCAQELGYGAKICTDCGIHVHSGRPLLTSEGLDENIVYGNAHTAIRVASWLVWVTPLPIPLASAAYGKHKPYAIWTIAAVTIFVSLIFLLATWGGNREPAKLLMLWPNHGNFEQFVQQHIPHASSGTRRDSTDEDSADDPDPRQLEELRQIYESRVGAFHWWQLFTHALLHDPNSLLGFVMHLGGNLLFMIVFGSRVNAIIGNVATAVLYPLLAAAAALTYLATLSAGQLTPMLGASGAINGLAGMYLVLFPAHRVYCAMWFRLRFWLALKIFPMRGFWLLLIYFAFDSLMVLLGGGGHTAHWAHIGGFLAGVAVGLVLLLSRQFDCRNGDLLSLALGKHAWPLIGKPRRLVLATA